MATRKMSAEEAAVRKALAAVQADTGIATAQKITSEASGPQVTAAASNYEDTRNKLSQMPADSGMRARLEELYASLDRQTKRLVDQAEAIGYNVDPTTLALSQKPKGLTPEQIEAEKAAATKALADEKAAADKKAQDEKDQAGKRDAFAFIKSTLTTYGFSATEIAELNSFIEAGLINAKMGPEQLKADLRQLPTYKARFAGNATRLSGGYNALSESEYLQQEDDYSQIFNQYGVGNLSSRAQFSTLIGNNVSITEATRRIDTSVRRVKNADPEILKNIKTYFPSITDTDIVSYFLKPTETLPELERKTTIAEIGATAKQFGMKETGLARIEDLQQYGVTLASARAGYANIAEELPGATKLGNIYQETGTTYGQTEAEAEQFKDSAEAKRKKEKLISTEKASFQGSAGVGSAGLSTTFLRKGSSAGQF